MPRKQRQKAPPKRDAKLAIPRAEPPDAGHDVTDEDMAILNSFIRDPDRPDSLRLNALKLKVARETAMLKERIAEKSTGMSITVNTLGEDEDAEE